MIDEFNMFANPHGLEDLTEEDSYQLQELYNVSYLYLILVGQKIQLVLSSIRPWQRLIKYLLLLCERAAVPLCAQLRDQGDH